MAAVYVSLPSDERENARDDSFIRSLVLARHAAMSDESLDAYFAEIRLREFYPDSWQDSTVCD